MYTLVTFFSNIYFWSVFVHDSSLNGYLGCSCVCWVCMWMLVCMKAGHKVRSQINDAFGDFEISTGCFFVGPEKRKHPEKQDVLVTLTRTRVLNKHTSHSSHRKQLFLHPGVGTSTVEWKDSTYTPLNEFLKWAADLWIEGYCVLTSLTMVIIQHTQIHNPLHDIIARFFLKWRLMAASCCK